MLEEMRSFTFADRVFDKLVPNGPNVKLGKIAGQNFRVFKNLSDLEAEQSEIEKSLNKKNKKTKSVSSHIATEKLLGFGWCWNNHPAFFHDARKDQFARSARKI